MDRGCGSSATLVVSSINFVCVIPAKAGIHIIKSLNHKGHKVSQSKTWIPDRCCALSGMTILPLRYFVTFVVKAFLKKNLPKQLIEPLRASL